MKLPYVSRKDLVDSASGALSGGITAVAVCPLDVLRTRFQVQSRERKYTTLVHALRLIVRQEGFAGLYRGLSPTLIALIPNWAVYFSIYEHLKQSFLPYVDKVGSPAVHMGAAIGAGVSTVVATNPLWVVKTRLQTQDMGLKPHWQRYSGTLDGLRSIVQKEGLSRLYAGLVPSLLGVAHVAVQFPLYEEIKARLAQRQGRGTEPLSVQELILASSASKMVASTATYPHEVLRSHMHFNGTRPFSGMRDTLSTIMREHGVLGFYKGCGINLCRAVPSAAITFTSFELISRTLREATLSSDHCKVKKMVAS